MHLIDSFRQGQQMNSSLEALALSALPSPTDIACKYALPIGFQQHHFNAEKHNATMEAFHHYLQLGHSLATSSCDTCAV